MAVEEQPRRRRGSARESAPAAGDGAETVDAADLEPLLAALRAAAEGENGIRVPARRRGMVGELGRAFNALAERREQTTRELARLSRRVGRDGRLAERASLDGAAGTWAQSLEALNGLVDDLVRPVHELARVLEAVAAGDLSEQVALEVDGRPLKGEFRRVAVTVNTLVEHLRDFSAEVTRVAREVGTEGRLGGRARVRGVSGVWADLTDDVNTLAANLTTQVRAIAEVTTAVARGDLSRKVTVDVRGEMLELKETINTMVDRLDLLADEVTRVAREVGTEGRLGGQARVRGVSGTWKDLTDGVNGLANNLTTQVRNIATVTTAVANGDLSKKITVDASGEMLELKETVNTMVDRLRSFSAEVTRVAREVGTEGKLGGQARVEGVSGVWQDLTESVNSMADNLTAQVRNIAEVTTAVANGDLSKKITVDVRGELRALKETVNTMVDRLDVFADEVTRVAKEVGTEGRLGGQARVRGLSGVWQELTDNVNTLADNLTTQVRAIAEVTTAVAEGDLTRKVAVDVRGEIAELKDTINTMVDRLSSFADEVTRVAREVGTEGRLGGQARVRGVSGTWEDLTDNVNTLADNLTTQVRAIAEVTTAVARGDLSQKITVDARGEIAELKNTINLMVDQLATFAAEVTRVAKEVGTEGRLGGQAEVAGVSGTWKNLTDSVNGLAETLTTQLRAIAEVSTAVTRGDLSREVAVEAAGEVEELRDTINEMIARLRETTTRNAEQDWLNSNLARFSGLLQGQRDLVTVSRLIMSELTPLVGAEHGAFFLREDADGDAPSLRLVASYGYVERKAVATRFALGEGLVGQAALEATTILVSPAPADYVKIGSGLGEAEPASIVVVPVLFEDQVLAVVELAAFRDFPPVQRAFLEGLAETIGIVLNTIQATMRTEQLLGQSQSLAQELQAQSEELQAQQEELQQTNRELEDQARSLRASEELLQQQQEELQQTNEELEEKASLLEEQNRRIEIKNREIELARAALEEKAEQLALSSRYKSEFLANMSHELRTPLNSLLILAKLLSENPDGNLSGKQVEFARTIHTAGGDLLQLINDILDLSKIEAGKMPVHPVDVALASVREYAERTFGPLAEEKGLALAVEVAPEAGEVVHTDEQRLLQVLRNLLSNAFKFTEAGRVVLRIAPVAGEHGFASPSLARAERVLALSVTDTGIGIPHDKLRLIFEAFQQADGSTARRYGGTGLGLSISRELARLLGGEIRVESEEGEGSTFTLYLPDRYGEPAAPPEPAGGTPGFVLFERGGNGAETAEPALDPALLGPAEVDDDRREIGPQDRVVLIVEDDPDFARTVLETARACGFKGVVALRGDTGLALAREYRPDAIVLDLQLPVLPGAALLERLKRNPDTRHIPVHIVSGAEGDGRQDALRAGAAAFLRKPVGKERLEAAFGEIAAFIERGVKRLLVVEDDEAQRRAVAELIGAGDDVEVVGVGSSEEALARLADERYDCMVLDLKLPRKTGFALLEQVKEDERFRDLPIIVYTGRELTRQEEARIRRYAQAIVVKGASSPERLLDETSLFLHRVESELPQEKRRMLEQLHSKEAVFEGKRVLIVDDDVRNVFALTSVLEAHGMEVVYAENGREALERLEAHAEVDLVLMDIMMPELDGYEATRRIRARPEFERLPIIALTAKAMKGDREKTIAAGASDYVTKPVDTDQLLSLLRVWLYR